MKTVDVAVVGNGILGLEAVRGLLAAGQNTLLFGPASVPATWAAGGMLVPFAEHIPDDDVLLYSRECVTRWCGHAAALEEEGIACGYRPFGVFLPVKEQFAPLYAMIRSRLDQFDEPWEERAWQGLDSSSVEGLLLPNGASVANGRMWRGLWHKTRSVHCYAEVVAIEGREGAFELRLSDGTAIAARQVLLFPGWRSDLVAALPSRHTPFADRGAMIRVVPPVMVKDEPILFDVDMMAPLYMVPRSDGGLTIGATTDPQDEDMRWREGDETLLLQRAAQYLPWLCRERITHRWVGMRPKSESGYPWVGELPGRPGIWTVTGMHRNGILWGPFLARAVVDMMNGKAVELPESFTRL